MLSKQICEYNTILEMNCAMCVDKWTSATCISDDYRTEGAWGQYYAIDLPHDHVTCVLYLAVIFSHRQVYVKRGGHVFCCPKWK